MNSRLKLLGLGIAFWWVSTGMAAAATSNEFQGQKLTIELNGWMVFGGSDDGAIGLFRAPVTVTSEGYRRIWERWEYPDPIKDLGPLYRSDMQFVENDCNNRRMRTITRYAFSGNNLGDHTVWGGAVNSGWFDVPPGTMADALLDLACKSQGKAGARIMFPVPLAISDAQVRLAVAKYRQTQNTVGITGAEFASIDCFKMLEKRPSWAKIDYCLAFDDAAGILDAGMSDLLKAPPNEYFSISSRVARARTQIGRLTPDLAEINNRMVALNEKASVELNQSFVEQAK